MQHVCTLSNPKNSLAAIYKHRKSRNNHAIKLTFCGSWTEIMELKKKLFAVDCLQNKYRKITLCIGITQKYKRTYNFDT